MSREELVGDLNVEVRRNQNAQDAFDEAACARLGINRTDARCLDIIDRNGRVTAGALASEASLSTGAVTTVLDRLERARYVRRVRDTEDRRRVLVEMTDEARARAEEIWGPVAAESSALLERYSDEELRFLLEFLKLGRDFLDRHRARIAAQPAEGAAGQAARSAVRSPSAEPSKSGRAT